VTGSLWTTDGGFGWTWSHDGIHVDAIHARTIVDIAAAFEQLPSFFGHGGRAML
jgi:hypothetical protein